MNNLDPFKIAIEIALMEDKMSDNANNTVPINGLDFITKTIIIDKKKMPVEILSLSGKGKLEEMTVVSPVKYRVIIRVDDTEVYNTYWDVLKDYSKYMQNMAAYIDTDGKYVFNVKNISFGKRIQVMVNGNGYIDGAVAQVVLYESSGSV